MNTNSALNRHSDVLASILVGIIVLLCVGCQTFNLSEEDFQKQQRGQMVDRETGDAVGAAGTLGYYGAVIGALVAEVVRK